MATRSIVTLTAAERTQLLTRTQKGKGSARKLSRAHTRLQAEAGAPDATIAAALHRASATVERTRKRCVEEGREAALTERPRPGGRRKLEGKPEAFLIALACSTPPEGRTCWTMQLLADRLIELRVVNAIADETIRRTLQKTPSRPGQRRPGAFRA
jgi:hypothetical protein